MEGKFEKTRIQNPEKAHEEANMVKAQAEARAEIFHRGKENLTAEDYNAAIAVLEQLQEEILSPSVENATKPLRSIIAGVGALSENAMDLLGWSLLSAIPMPDSIKQDIKSADAKFPREKLVELVKGLSEGKLIKDYKENRAALASAREILERRQAEGEEIAKR